MFYFRRCFSLFIVLIMLVSCQSKDTTESPSKPSMKEVIEPVNDTQTPSYVAFPNGYGYMENLAQLQAATDAGDTAVIRQHAWSLWAGIMQPVEGLGWPLWYTWPNTKGAFVDQSSDAKVQIMQTKHAEKSQPKVLKKGSSLRQVNLKNKNTSHAPDVDTLAPTYKIPDELKQLFPNAICGDRSGEMTICDGEHFVNNGDIMIATESLSIEAMNDIRQKKLYLKSTLNQAHSSGESMIEVTDRFIVTKHMYWPVKAEGVTVIPVWKDNYPDSYSGYAGYEFWDTLVALEPSNPASVGQTVTGSFLYGVYDHTGDNLLPTVAGQAVINDINDFYHHQVTQADWDAFDDADKAIITAASLWANKKSFEVGDYLVTVAMHVNTKELVSWTLQSVWWSDSPNEGIYASDRPDLPQALGPWQHYLLTDAYAVPAVNGTLKKAVNPYIEGVIHPIATNCRNCHVRAGWPQNKASYQNPACPNLLQDLSPESDCLQGITLTDYLWIIPDRAQ